MATRKNKQNKKDAETKDAADVDDSVNMEALTSLLEDHRKSLSDAFNVSIAALESKLDVVHAAVTDHGQRITSLESNANAVSDRIAALEATCKELADANAKLRAKASDLESRNRRWNVRLVGLSETVGAGSRPTEFFSDFLVKLLGDQVLPKPPELDLAHRSLAAKPSATDKPRHVIIRFHNLQTKERVIQEARKRRADLKFEGNRIAIYEDYPADVMEQRGLYREVMAELYKLGLKPALHYPSKLMIKEENGDKIRLSSVDEAKNYISAKKRK